MCTELIFIVGELYLRNNAEYEQRLVLKSLFLGGRLGIKVFILCKFGWF